MTRVLAPGGHLAVATWCQREETPETPFSEEDKVNLNFLYEEWAHPYFVSKEEYARLMDVRCRPLMDLFPFLCGCCRLLAHECLHLHLMSVCGLCLLRVLVSCSRL